MLKRVDAPSAIMTVTEVKEDLLIEHDRDDAKLGRLIQRATEYLDGNAGLMGKALVSQQWTETFPFFESRMRLSIGPLIQLDSITYFDADDQEQTLGDIYRAYDETLGPFLWQKQNTALPSTYDRPDAVKVTFTCGYGDADAVPAPIKQAVSLLVGFWNEYTEAAAAEVTRPIAIGVYDLIAPFRNYK